MNTTTKLSALAIAATAFATTALLTGTASAAGFGHGFGHGPVVAGTGLAPRPPHLGGSVPPGVLRPLPYHPPGSTPPSHGGGQVVSCHPGTGCSVTPTHGDRDGYHRDHDHDRWFGWRGRPEIVVEEGPAVVAPPVPVAAGGVSAPPRAMAAPAQAMPRGPAPAPQVAEGPCNCLTKQYMPDGGVMFQDICTKESAMAAPQAVGAR
jgi:hypothetical protein